VVCYLLCCLCLRPSWQTFSFHRCSGSVRGLNSCCRRSLHSQWPAASLQQPTTYGGLRRLSQNSQRQSELLVGCRYCCRTDTQLRAANGIACNSNACNPLCGRLDVRAALLCCRLPVVVLITKACTQEHCLLLRLTLNSTPCVCSAVSDLMTAVACHGCRAAPKADSLDYLLQSDDSNAPLAPF
jgi:hypothetical protein